MVGSQGTAMMGHSGVECGEYVLFERIGHGGMGTVWRGEHRRTGRSVAVKVMERELTAGDEYVDWFHREIRAHARLRHPNIVQLFDVGEIDAATERAAEGELVEGAPYFVMEYLPHGTLRGSVVVSAWADLCDILLQILRGLSFAHARDVIHRDLKPSNLLCDRGRAGLRVKISDFGLAFEVQPDEIRSAPSSGRLVGTPDYMAPEQLGGNWRHFGPWTDLYALGCVAFELTTGRRPFPGSEPEEIASKHLTETIPGVDPLMAVPEGFEDWLRTSMSKSPSDRFWSAADAAHALRQLEEPPSEETAADPGLSGDPSEGWTASPSTPEMRPPETVRDARPNETATLPSPAQPTSAASAVEAAGLELEDGDALHTGRRPGERPPFPEDWRPEERTERQAPAPLGLFGLRELPFVGREDVRNRLWSLVESVVEEHETRVAVVSGASGVGKSRVVEWIGRRSVECGACTLLHTRHSRQGGPDEGLTGLLQNVFVTWEMTRSEVRRQVRATLEVWFDEEREDRNLDLDVRALTELIRPRGRASGFQFVAIRERFALITEVLGQLAERRPLFLWLDDVQWSPATLEFVQFLLDEAPTSNIMVALTVQSAVVDEASGLGGSGADLSAICRHPRCTHLKLEPLPRDEHRELVERMIAIEPGLAEEVVDRTEGTPLFAVELLRDWVDRDALVATDEGYALREDADPSLPDDLHRIWQRRLEHAAEALPEADRRSAMRSIEVAAVLGHQVPSGEWKVACRLVGATASELLVDRMIEQGLAYPEPAGWRFVHGMFVESLERRAREQRRFERYARACARAVEHCYPGQLRETASRRARYLRQAGALEVAAEVYLLAIERASEIGAVGEAQTLLQEREEVVDELGCASEDRARVEQSLMKARHESNRGRHEEASELVGHVLHVATENGWSSLEAQAHIQVSVIAHRGGGQQKALEALDRAERILRALGDKRSLASALTRRAVVRVWGGDYDTARDAAVAAERLFESLEDPMEACRARTWKAYALIYEGSLEEAQSIAEELVEEARRHGLRWVERESLNQLGEIARYQERWEEAREHYRDYRRLNRRAGLFDHLVGTSNLALVELGAGNDERAAEMFDELHGEIDGGVRHLAPTVALGRLAAAAALDRDDLGELLREVEEAFESVETREPSQRWVAERAVAQLERRGDTERVRRIRELVADGERAR